MTDLITYCDDTATLIEQLKASAPQLIHIDPATGEARFLVPKTPTVRNGNKTLALVRDVDGSLQALAASLTTLQVLGTYDEVFADPAKRAIYDSVYDQTPRTYTDPEGVEQTYTPPEKFGVIA